ncbi:D-3-phosphoglycerate dehydrogenase [Paenibacillus cellulosilyticus]|uniref:D-3-phosphoglycerate dehydrogenase n=1 Tax=Paenibacillus cellulosilyticus TaxID=375489 RepID=A0A2V2Z3E1_9BACL|nr:NAD(P)-dependent oxidoreductase [Paenibacillus cellulosilyticus]PWW08330.1 D-3-phosphoglycerate dehydrogenase [Paenibacillus cellulosilyticus]QKS47929.1 hydroxyacid dehydrogenase [Paenibacillus cellulosilyticus]
MKIVVGASSFAAQSDKAINILLEKGIEVVKNPFGRKMNIPEIIEHLRDADGLLAGLETLNEEVYRECPKLKAIARIGIGMENVDVQAAEKRGINVSNTPDAPSEAVAEMVLTALLAISRELIQLNKDMHNKVWQKRIGFSLRNRNVLLVGYGRVGRKFAELLKPFGANIMIYDPFQSNISLESLNKGLEVADIVSLHASGADELLTKEAIKQMKKGVVILNSARGLLINEEALVEALQTGAVSWYWSDVYSEEPYRGKLTELDNALLTPHTATYIDRCREEMEQEAVYNILRDLNDV